MQKNVSLAATENIGELPFSLQEVSPFLTRLTWLIHTSILPSNWNPDKIFATTGLLGQVHIVKKYFWNSSMREPFSFNSFYLIVLRKITNSLTKMTNFPHGGKSEKIFFAICTWPNSPVRAKILSRFQFEGKNDVWIS